MIKEIIARLKAWNERRKEQAYFDHFWQDRAFIKADEMMDASMDDVDKAKRAAQLAAAIAKAKENSPMPAEVQTDDKMAEIEAICDDIKAASDAYAAFQEKVTAQETPIRESFLSEQAAILEQFKARDAADRASYRFSCTRHGDFMTLNIRRPSIAEKSLIAKDEMQFVTTINLSKFHSIDLMYGYEPDMNGKVPFTVKPDFCRTIYANVYTMNSKTCVDINKDIELDLDVPPYKIEGIYTLDDQVPTRKEMREPKPGRPIYMVPNCAYEQANLLQHPLKLSVIENCAQQAVDDVVVFRGQGVTANVFAPNGFGRYVHDTILTELGDKQ